MNILRRNVLTVVTATMTVSGSLVSTENELFCSQSHLSLNNGKVYTDVMDVKFTSKAVYVCNTGFQLVGNAVRFCMKSNCRNSAPHENTVNTFCWSGEAPVCVRNSNASCSTDTFHLDHGRIIPRKPHKYEYNIKLKAIHICDSGYQLQGNAVRICHMGYVDQYTSKQWSGEMPKCVRDSSAYSIFEKCPKNQLYLNKGSIIIINKSDNIIVKGTMAVHFCNKGYNLRGNWLRFCTVSQQYAGKWSGEEPQCVKDTSFYPGDKCSRYSMHIRNGKVNFVHTYLKNNIAFGTQAIHTCHKGFKLVGRFVIKCLVVDDMSEGHLGKWSALHPSCISESNITECLELPSPEHGLVMVSGYKRGDIARYKCKRHYQLNNRAIRKCTIHGTWSGYPPLCIHRQQKDGGNEGYKHFHRRKSFQMSNGTNVSIMEYSKIYLESICQQRVDQLQENTSEVFMCNQGNKMKIKAESSQTVFTLHTGCCILLCVWHVFSPLMFNVFKLI